MLLYGIEREITMKNTIENIENRVILRRLSHKGDYRVLNIRLRPLEHDALRRAAVSSGVSMSRYVVDVALERIGHG